MWLIDSSALFLIVAPSLASEQSRVLADPVNVDGWCPLFNGKNLDSWYSLQKYGRDSDPEHVVTIEGGKLHAYKSARDRKKW